MIPWQFLLVNLPLFLWFACGLPAVCGKVRVYALAVIVFKLVI